MVRDGSKITSPWWPCRVIPVLLAATLLLPAIGCQRTVDLEIASMLDRAQKTFDQAESQDDFLLAASHYQAILDRGIVSGAVLFNQANAYMRAGQRGRAIASYRQAKRYRPRDPYLDANLRFALGADNPTSSRGLVGLLLFWQDWISYPGKFHLAGALAVVSFLLASAYLVSRRRLFARLTIATLCFTLILAMSAAYDWHRYEAVVHGVVVVDGVVARKGNATTYEPAFTEPLVEGTEFRLVEQRGDWVLMHLEDGPDGWVEKRTVQLY
jgi:hypothetical protein